MTREVQPVDRCGPRDRYLFPAIMQMPISLSRSRKPMGDVETPPTRIPIACVESQLTILPMQHEGSRALPVLKRQVADMIHEKHELGREVLNLPGKIAMRSHP